MPIPDDQLALWSRQGDLTAAQSTAETLRNALTDEGNSLVWNAKMEMFLHGSYANGTNLTADGNVDMAVMLTSPFSQDFGLMAGVGGNKQLQSSLADFRLSVLGSLRARFGMVNVEDRPECVFVVPEPGRLGLNVAVMLQHRLYSSFSGSAGGDYLEGVTYWTPDGRQIVCYPKTHLARGAAKDAATHGWFKSVVRMFKGARLWMISQGMLNADAAPPYFVECLLYNVPDQCFGGSCKDSFVGIVKWLGGANPQSFKAQSGEGLLLGSGPAQWSEANARAFLQNLLRLWSEWGAIKPRKPALATPASAEMGQEYQGDAVPQSQPIPIPEDQLKVWSQVDAASPAQSVLTDLQTFLECDSRSLVRGAPIEVFLQGSHKNGTYLAASADADIVFVLDCPWSQDFGLLAPAKLETRQLRGAWSDFRSAVAGTLREKYGPAAVSEHPKCLRVAPAPGRIGLDVVVGLQHRLYLSFGGLTGLRYLEGIAFWTPDDRQIVNYPKIHSENGGTKDFATRGWFRPMVRVVKNARALMAGRGILPAREAPSYFLECLFYNVPNHCFGGSYQKSFTEALRWLAAARLESFKAQDEITPLFGAGPAQWSVAGARQFVQALDSLCQTWS
ncbi:MAG: hypothetical protein NTY77_07610 [Elusimicrobia bacterium]|nr:hypothetical protein [Elusimicrobiota bacterium]